MVLGKRLYPSANSAITHYTILCNISLYCDTEEVVYRYTQNVYHCISSMHVCMCVYMCMYMCVYTYVRVYVYVSVCVYVCEYMCVCVYICVYVCVCE